MPDQLSCSRACEWPEKFVSDGNTDVSGADTANRPKLATHGTLCDACYLRMKEALNLIPELILNMRSQVIPASNFELTERVQGGGDGAPVPLNVGAVDAADALFAKVASWVGAFAEELTIPVPIIRSWRVKGEVQGSRILDPATAMELTEQLTSWLARHIEQISASTTAATFHDDIWEGWEDSPGVVKLSRRYGSEERKPRDAQKRVCPICGKKEVFAAAPSTFDNEPMVLCGLCNWTADLSKKPEYLEMFKSA